MKALVDSTPSFGGYFCACAWSIAAKAGELEGRMQLILAADVSGA
jgi:hypothetical protein